SISFRSLSSALSWLLLPLRLPATSRNTKLLAILPQTSLHQSTLLLANLHQQLTLLPATTRITNTLISPSPANLTNASSMAAANGGNK
ncbi:Uncharacterized protein APZ42_010483, partial [Daphnia magna]